MLGIATIALALFIAATEPADASPTRPLPPGVEFIWDAPASCPDAQAVTARVAELLGERTLDRRVSVIARVRLEDDGMWDMRLYTVTPEGTRDRTLRHARCDLLAEATAIVVVVAVDPHTHASIDTDVEARALADSDAMQDTAEETVANDFDPPSPGTELEAAPEASDSEATPDRAKGPAPKEARPHPRGLTRVEGGFDLGMTRKIAGTVAVAVGIAWPRVRLELLARGVFPRAHRTSPGRGADLWGWTIGARGCPVFGRTVQFLGCVAAEAGEVLAEPVGLVDSRRGREAWVGLGLAPTLAWVPHPRVAITLGLEGLLALRRPAFDLSDGTVLYRAPIGSLRGNLGLELRFP